MNELRNILLDIWHGALPLCDVPHFTLCWLKGEL